MVCTITFHDRVGPRQLADAVAPIAVDQFHAILASALGETTRAAAGSRAVEVELTLCGDEQMTHLNFDHMGERGPTDVLAFPLHDWEIEGGRSHLADEDSVAPPGPLLLGDVVVDLDQAVRQAAQGGWSVTEEVVLLAIHGTLHLLGHDHADPDEEEVMRGLERRVLAVLHRKHRDVAWQPGSLFDRAGHAVSAGA